MSSPTLRSDGDVLATPGYDEATGLLYVPGGEVFPPVPARPTRQNAEAALQVIEDLLADFPFVSEHDRAAAVAAILTACVRRSLRTAPIFVFTAPVAGSGKSRLVDLASLIASGREAGAISQGKNEIETEKRITALLLSGSPIAIDNVEAGIGGDLLCQLLTLTSVRMRVLGRSETSELPTNVLVTATGNNVAILGDVAARFLSTLLTQPKVKRLLSTDHFSVDGTLVQGWASMKSFKPVASSDEPRPDDPPPPDGGRNVETNFRGETRSNATHASTTDPDAKLYRKGPGMEAKLAFLGHAERLAALAMIEPLADRPVAVTLGADKGYDALDFVNELRSMNVRPHVNQNTTRRFGRFAINGRTTRHAGYAASQRIRKRIEEAFGWMKSVGGIPLPILVDRLNHLADEIGGGAYRLRMIGGRLALAKPKAGPGRVRSRGSDRAADRRTRAGCRAAPVCVLPAVRMHQELPRAEQRGRVDRVGRPRRHGAFTTGIIPCRSLIALHGA